MPVAFREAQFPVDYAQGTSGGPTYSTRVITMAGGDERRIQNWEDSKLKYEIGYTANPTDMATIIAFFRAVAEGRTYGWRFKDWSDFKATLEVMANNLGTTLKLVKTYTFAGFSKVRRINKPCNNGTFHLFHNGVEVTSGFTLDYTTGIITIPGGVTSGTWAWTGEFDVPMRFDVDQLPFVQDNVGKRSISSVPITEMFIEDAI